MAKNDLHALVRSLNPQEVQRFRSLSAHHKNTEESVYLKLFNLLLNQKDYNESELKKKLPESAKNFHKTKSYLFDEILHKLIPEYRITQPSLQLMDDYASAHFLFAKKLFGPCLETLEQIIEKSMKAELFDIAMSAAAQYRVCLQNQLRYREVVAFHERHMEMTRLFSNYQEYKSLECAYYELKNKSKQFVRDSKDDIETAAFFDHPLLQDESLALSNKARATFHELQYDRYARFVDTLDKSVWHAEKALRYYNLTEQSGVYTAKSISYLRNITLFYIELNEMDKAWSFIREMENAKTSGERTEHYRFHYLLYVRIYACYMMREKVKGLAFIEEYLADPKTKALTAEDLHYNINFYMIAIFMMCFEEYERVFPILNQLLNDKAIEEKHPAYYAEYRIFQLICHFEQKNVDLLEPLVRKLEYLLNKKHPHYLLEKQLLNFFKRFLKNSLQETLYFNELLSKMEELRKDEYGRHSLLVLDGIGWVERMKKKLGLS